ncbi:hypothetical protein BKA70DRAFT_1257871 [Coprinopsis sp. MPI-PUGE-AT-0042]|nr:hypothetical protein BKA70DRAFT_1257871 [Coprinopsis sp. MPI-PUGE-AT-0042]
MRSFIVLASLVASVLSYEVVRPSRTSGWTNQGPQTVTWDRVNTDPDTFSIVLTNTNRDLLASDIVLATNVDGASASSITIDEPAEGWPEAGGSFRINLVRSEDELNSILAQSNEFNVTAGTSSASASASGSSTISSSASSASRSTGPRPSATSSVRDATVSGMIAPDDAPGAASRLHASLAAAVAGLAAIGGLLL